ncbi:queuosine precursor transporter [uncultured Maricaulis sp.]|uniref:queuosine precursor transporter n=1 Tax=uncultured Maricaulis sp. TaxID=174710 RepID=UPI0030DDAEFC|tara:strand:+ start:258805 stop:259527 length:723 start_codon:yes stop_codon:yes gene_type:complete
MQDDSERSLHDAGRLTRKAITLFFCIGLFMVSLVLAAMTAIKLQEFHFGGLSVLVPAGTIAFGLTYLATDAISEVWGRSYALCVVLVGLVMRVLMIVLVLYAVHAEDVFSFITVADNWTPERQSAFASVMSSSNRLNIAGMVAFGISASADVLIYHYFQQRDAGKNRLWFRNNISTMVSQMLNSVIFICVGFLGTVPLAAIGSLILGQIIVKILVAAFDTPAIYLIRNYAEGRRLLDWRG